MSYLQFGELGKRPGKFRKLLRKAGALTAGATGGLVPFVKPGMLGVKSKSGKKMFRVGRVVGAATAAFYAGPLLATKLGAKAGISKIGALKFLGGKLVSAPKMLMDKLSSKGIDPKTATPAEVIQAGQETGYVTPGIIDNALKQLGVSGGIQSVPVPEGSPEYPEGATYPVRPTEEGSETATPVSEAGMFGGGGLTPILYLGAGFLALMMFGGKKGRS